MISKKELIDNELMKEIIGIRIDSLWKVFSLERKGLLPKIDEEGATGDFDNKGALFIPGGLVFEDSDRNPINKEGSGEISAPEKFREKVREAMQHDNATLLNPSSIVSGVNLDNGFFAQTASDIIAHKVAATRRSSVLRESPPQNVNSESIAKSHCPPYVSPPYGSRTKLSLCMAVCLIEPRTYFVQCKNLLGLRGEREEKAWSDIRSSRKQIVASDQTTTLAQPHIVICHNTRYREGTYTGITKILGYGKFGEFTTFTLEEATTDLLHEVDPGRTEYKPDEFVAEYRDRKITAVLRSYPPTTPGSRLLRGVNTVLVSPEKDINIDVKEIEREARKRYNVK